LNSKEKLLETLQHYWGYNSFRPQQEDIICSVLAGNDTLALLPTGGGKSICFQVPGLLSGKLCLVISPLIALMRDQVGHLVSKGITAHALFSGQSAKEQNTILDQAVNNQLSFLYLSPERLASKDFRGWLQNMELGLIAVDEAHCISQWGYDFRQEYLQIAEIRELFPNVPMLALTASATKEVVKDIMKSLKFRPTAKVFQNSFIRENLIYITRKVENKNLKILEICKKVQGTGIIYSRNRRGTEEISKYLSQNGIQSDFYHAGLTTEERNQKQSNWISNKTRVIVCTNAFGMGIDKPDVRFVVHYEPPDCLESYYQEAGRAGRDGQKAYCILCYMDIDFENERTRINEQFPDNTSLNSIYQKICNFLKIMEGSGQGISHDFTLSQFCNEYKLPLRNSYFAISLLQKLGYLQINETGIVISTLKILVTPQELYQLQVQNENYNLLFLAILRTRGGYFDFYTQIDELKIALLINTQEANVKKMLLALHKEGYIDYIPKTSTPQLILTESRYDKINPNRTLVNLLHKKAIERFESIRTYVQNEKICNNRFLALYFGEKSKYTCGKCNVCIENNIEPLSEKEFEIYMNLIQDKLTKQKQDLKSLVLGLKTSEKRKFLEAFEWMLNNNWITRDKTGLFEWKKRGK